MTEAELEKKLVNVTAEFDVYFTAQGNPNWQKPHRRMQIPDIYYCAENGCYYQYWPAFCAADEKLPRWQILGHNFEDTIKKLKFYL